MNIVQHIRTKADLNEWDFFVYNPQSYDYEMKQIDLSNGKIVLTMSPPAMTPIFSGGYYTGEQRFRFRLLLSRKTEPTTTSSIKETFAQKYDNRINELMNLLSTFVVDLGCSAVVSIGDITPQVNLLSASMDGAECEVTMTFSGQYD